MRVSIVQVSLHWENPAQNLADLAARMSLLQGKTDLIVLPEMFTTGFSMNARDLADTMQGPTLSWLSEQAFLAQAAIVGSFICREGAVHYNRLVFMRPDGTFDTYDKKHRFALAGEHEHYEAGEKRLIVLWKGWRICPLICYDLRFPVWCRNDKNTPYDLLIFVANWPERRAAHWKSLLLARAIENQSFTIGVNIFGADGNGLKYSGDSAIIDYSGQTLCQISAQEGVNTTELIKSDLEAYRKQLPFLEDADQFTLL